MSKSGFSEYIRVCQRQRDEHIYRIFPIERLLEVLWKEKNVLVQPRLWDDPWENCLQDYRYRFAKEQERRRPNPIRTFGQCWTWKEESDAMWRIYSGDKHGIRVATTPKRLIRSACDSLIRRKAQVVLGSVEYKKRRFVKKAISRLASEEKKVKRMQHARTLLRKRREFSHEREIRLLYISTNKQLRANKLLPYPCSPLDLFDSYMFDPRLPRKEVDGYTLELEALGCDPAAIEQSKLYDVPKSWLPADARD